MSSVSMINVEHRQTLSGLFQKFIRMTLKPNNENKKFKTKQTRSNIQQINHFYSSSTKQKQDFLVQSSLTLNTDQHKFISNSYFSNISSTSNQNHIYTFYSFRYYIEVNVRIK